MEEDELDLLVDDSDESDDEWEDDDDVNPLRKSKYPRGTTARGDQWLTIVDINGVHHLPVRRCACEKSNPDSFHDELVRMGLYPATHDVPNTVFTFRALNDYNLTNLETKCAGQSYFNKLSRQSQNCFPRKVPHRYAELLRVTREWRNLKARKRAGCGYGQDVPLEKGGLAIFCPACPQPGVNLPEDWENDPDKYARYSRPLTHVSYYYQAQIHAYPSRRRQFQTGAPQDEMPH